MQYVWWCHELLITYFNTKWVRCSWNSHISSSKPLATLLWKVNISFYLNFLCIDSNVAQHHTSTFYFKLMLLSTTTSNCYKQEVKKSSQCCNDITLISFSFLQWNKNQFNCFKHAPIELVLSHAWPFLLFCLVCGGKCYACSSHIRDEFSLPWELQVWRLLTNL